MRAHERERERERKKERWVFQSIFVTMKVKMYDLHSVHRTITHSTLSATTDRTEEAFLARPRSSVSAAAAQRGG